MVYGLFSRDDPDAAARELAEIESLGVDSIAIMIPWVTPHVRSLEMAPRADMTPDDEPLARTIRMARRRGMTVLLMPFLYVDHMEEGEWRGTIHPPDWGAWFRTYGDFILHYARLAEKGGVATFSVGSELCSTESRTADWAALVGRVRQVYSGRITYSANWDHRVDLPLADLLDVVGMNAYFRLADGPAATEEELVAAWSPIRREVEAWRASAGKPLILTEVGWPSRTEAAVDPWNYAREAPAAPEEQALLYRAFRRVWEGDPHLEGVYFYHWWGDGGLADTGYTPRGKPAEAVIREWYGRKRP